jgi:hypothetical protein
MKYTNIEIDHIFTIVSPSFPEKNLISRNDLIGNRNKHKDQGTSAEFMAFEQNYLEFIWLSDQEEARSNDLHLQQRFTSNQCPFGFGFRGKIDEDHLDDFNIYKPSYLSQGRILDHKSQQIDYKVPMFFIMDLDKDIKSFYPTNIKSFSSDVIQTGKIERVILHTPYPSPTNALFPQIEQVKSNKWGLQVIGLEDNDFSPLPLKTILNG